MACFGFAHNHLVGQGLLSLFERGVNRNDPSTRSQNDIHFVSVHCYDLRVSDATLKGFSKYISKQRHLSFKKNFGVS